MVSIGAKEKKGCWHTIRRNGTANRQWSDEKERNFVRVQNQSMNLEANI